MKNNYSYALIFIGVVVLRKLLDKSLLIGVGIGMLLSFYILKGNFVESISKFTVNKEKNETKLQTINNEPTIKKVFKDINKYATQNNYININESLEHMEQFLKIRKNIKELDNKKQFYDLAKMERKKSLDSLVSSMVTMDAQKSKKLKKIIKYLGKTTKKILLQIGNIVNKEWNDGNINQRSGVINLD